ncbi:MAG: hypothetical protein KKD74_00845 [Bacteroidetes bacterium]|nr:hypothetical protein [Bacteroidota bacterium]
MLSISEKINAISHFWIYYACYYQTIRKKLNWSEKNNPTFFGDRIEYLKLSSELVFEKYNPKTVNLLSLTGAIQMMYVQQDLLDELRMIFRLPQANKTGYVLRQMRNELIGHPISWDEKGNLKSTVLWNGGFNGESIDYVKYASENNFEPEEETKYSLAQILIEHEKFVNKQFDEIIRKINSIRKKYQSQIAGILKLQDDTTEFPKYLRLTQQLFEGVFEQSHAFRPDILQEYYTKIHEQNRYKYVIEQFISTIRNQVSETVEDMEKGLTEKTRHVPSQDFKVKLISNAKNLTSKNKNHTVDYILSKLVERKPVCLPSDLLPYVNEDSLAIAEIQHMEKYYQSDLEYYSAFEHLCFLIGHQ